MKKRVTYPDRDRSEQPQLHFGLQALNYRLVERSTAFTDHRKTLEGARSKNRGIANQSGNLSVC
jgi:hypothetical protein